MSGWRIDPAGISEVLTGVQGDAVELGSAFSPVEGAVENLVAGTGVGAYASAQTSGTASGAGLLGPVTAAVMDVLQQQGDVAAAMQARIVACANGAADATVAYVNGDEQMAASTQAAGVAAAENAATAGLSRG